MAGWARAGEVAGLAGIWTELRVGGGSRPWTGLVAVCEVGTGGRHVM